MTDVLQALGALAFLALVQVCAWNGAAWLERTRG